MIVKSSQRSGARNLADHLKSDENESVRVVGSQGIVASSSISGALAEMKAIGMASRCSKHLFHASISPASDKNMTESQWKRVWDLHDEVQGTKDLSYIEVEHCKNNRTHRHRVYERVDFITGYALNLSWTRIKNERIARQLEHELGHPVIQGKHNRSVSRILHKEGLIDIAVQLDSLGSKQPVATDYTHQEWQQKKSDKFSLDNVRSDLADSWQESNDTKSFEASLANRGYILAQGEKAVLAIGPDNTQYPLLRSINVAHKKLKKQSIRKRELDFRLPDLLPTWHEAVKQYEEFIWAKLDNLVDQTTTLEQLDKAIEQQMQIYEDSCSDHLNRIEPPALEKDKWIKYREELLRSQYKTLNLDLITPFWMVHQHDNGTLQLTNKTGYIRDLGDNITTNSDNHLLSAQVMTQLCVAKGWTEVRAEGSDDFKLASYKELLKNDIECIIENRNDEIIWLQAQREVAPKPRGLSLNL